MGQSPFFSSAVGSCVWGKKCTNATLERKNKTLETPPTQYAKKLRIIDSPEPTHIGELSGIGGGVERINDAE